MPRDCNQDDLLRDHDTIEQLRAENAQLRRLLVELLRVVKEVEKLAEAYGVSKATIEDIHYERSWKNHE